jgi:hypothetical protein
VPSGVADGSRFPVVGHVDSPVHGNASERIFRGFSAALTVSVLFALRQTS